MKIQQIFQIYCYGVLGLDGMPIRVENWSIKLQLTLRWTSVGLTLRSKVKLIPTIRYWQKIVGLPALVRLNLSSTEVQNYFGASQTHDLHSGVFKQIKDFIMKFWRRG